MNTENLFAPENYLTEAELATLWGMKRNTLQKWRSLGVGPAYIKRVGRIVYRKDALAEFEKSQTYRGTENYAQAK
ncbi:MAG: helix-turn-helix domain-containing protein [Rickettsiales bacterium]|jgi:predicted site-specific integrase-resolvase|nr:helix-turn-helix domain-containing protein [Rickettsiales bacterium]